MATSRGTAKVRTKLRFQMQPLDTAKMRQVAEATFEDVKARVLAGRNVKDVPARPLSRGWARRKKRKGLPAKRDFVFTGRMMASFGVQTSSNNRAVIGFSSGLQAAKAEQNNRVEPMIGMSLGNRRVFRSKVRELAKIEAVRVS